MSAKRFMLTRPLSVGKKILSIIGLCLFLLVAVAAMSVWQLQKLNQEFKSITNFNIPLSSALSQLSSHQLEQAIYIERALRLSQEQDSQKRGAEFSKLLQKITQLGMTVDKEFVNTVRLTQQAQQSISRLHHAFLDLISSDLKDIDQAYKAYASHSKRLFIDAKNEENVAGAIIKIEKLEDELVKKFENLRLKIEQFASQVSSTISEQQAFAIKMISFVSGLALIIGILLSAILVIKHFSQPLKDITKAIDALSVEDTSVEVKVHYNDEIGEVARALDKFRALIVKTKDMQKKHAEDLQHADENRIILINEASDAFNATIGEISMKVAAATEQLKSASTCLKDISVKADNQASHVANASNDASMNIQTIAGTTEEMSAAIAEVNHQVLNLSQTSQTALSQITNTNKNMSQLTTNSDKIGEVSAMISDIAEQTNLLALNATIESARAGEAGKGFAVVAGEVKTLANETAKATNQISEQIQKIQAATHDTSSSMDEIKRVNGNLQQMASSLAAAMEQQDTATREIARSVQDAATGTKEISNNMFNVAESSKKTSEASEEVMEATASLAKLSDSLQEEVDKFTSEVLFAYM